MSKQDVYRIVDAEFRIHDDLLHLEYVLNRSMAAQFKIARLRTNSTMGVVVAGALAVVPILVSVSNIDWTSAPAWIFYAIAVGLLVLWVYQIVDARKTETSLGVAEETNAVKPLKSRPMYLFERIAMYGTRLRLVEETLEELNVALPTLAGERERAAAVRNIQRFEDIRADCEDSIVETMRESRALHLSGQLSDARWTSLLEWARPFVPEAALAELLAVPASTEGGRGKVTKAWRAH